MTQIQMKLVRTTSGPHAGLYYGPENPEDKNQIFKLGDSFALHVEQAEATRFPAGETGKAQAELKRHDWESEIIDAPKLVPAS
jgi:hypothetical protein